MESRKSPSFEPASENAPQALAPQEAAKTSKSKKSLNARDGALNRTDTSLRQNSATRENSVEKPLWSSENVANAPDKTEREHTFENLFGNSKESNPQEQETPKPLDRDVERHVLTTYAESRSQEVVAEAAKSQDASDETSPRVRVAEANHTLLENIKEHAQHPEHTTADEVLEYATKSTVEELQLPTAEHTTPAKASEENQPFRRPSPPSRLQAQQQEAVIASILTESQPDPSTEQTPEPTPTTETSDFTAEEPVSVSPPLFGAGSGNVPPRSPDRPGFADDEHEPGSNPSRADVETPLSVASSAAPPMPLSVALHEAHDTHEPVSSGAAAGPVEHIHDNRRRSDVAAGVLIGGLAGYAIGRRGGRKRAEAQQKITNEKHAKQVSELEDKIAQREQYVRSLAAQKVAQEHALPANHATQAEHGVRGPVKAVIEKPVVSTHELPGKDTAGATEKVPQSSLAHTQEQPKIEVVNAVQTPAEQKSRAKEPVSSQPLRPEQILAVKSVDKMSKDEVVTLAQSVTVGSKNLRTYYETGQINERALRKVLTEHRRTGWAERALYAELHKAPLSRPEQQSAALAESQSTTTSSSTRQTRQHTIYQDHSGAQQSQTVLDTAKTSSASDDVYHDYTPRIGMTKPIIVIAAIVLAFFVLRIILD